MLVEFQYLHHFGIQQRGWKQEGAMCK